MVQFNGTSLKRRRMSANGTGSDIGQALRVDSVYGYASRSSSMNQAPYFEGVRHEGHSIIPLFGSFGGEPTDLPVFPGNQMVER